MEQTDSQSTRLLKKKREMREVDDAMELMKEQYRQAIIAIDEKHYLEHVIGDVDLPALRWAAINPCPPHAMDLYGRAARCQRGARLVHRADDGCCRQRVPASQRAPRCTLKASAALQVTATGLARAIASTHARSMLCVVHSCAAAGHLAHANAAVERCGGWQRMERCDLRQREFEAKQLEMKEQVQRFEKFIQENDAKRARAEAKAKQERRALEQREAELKRLSEELSSALSEEAALKDRRLRLRRYQAYLGAAVAASEQGFDEIGDLLNRFGTLRGANTDLSAQLPQGHLTLSRGANQTPAACAPIYTVARPSAPHHSEHCCRFGTLRGANTDLGARCARGEGEMERRRAEALALRQDAQNALLVHNSALNERQRELEGAREGVKHAMEKSESEAERVKGIAREGGQLVAAVRNLYTRCKQTMRNPLPDAADRREDDRLAQLARYLSFIGDRIEDLAEVEVRCRNPVLEQHC
ncbi:hypothetical protein JKP88DRAFT_254967 [Tribonema minus]|uniref:DUF4200 domain-containing protein n=1 Tax=Tribonema minus TaxID=303371 RepID=A0A835Z0W5_9STRA|nr:hypothetical protein JKP88DRAFT_254967 [Tribonema minus]